MFTEQLLAQIPGRRPGFRMYSILFRVCTLDSTPCNDFRFIAPVDVKAQRPPHAFGEARNCRKGGIHAKVHVENPICSCWACLGFTTKPRATAPPTLSVFFLHFKLAERKKRAGRRSLNFRGLNKLRRGHPAFPIRNSSLILLNIRRAAPRDELKLGKLPLHVGQLPLVAEQQHGAPKPVLCREDAEELPRFLKVESSLDFRAYGRRAHARTE